MIKDEKIRFSELNVIKRYDIVLDMISAISQYKYVFKIKNTRLLKEHNRTLYREPLRPSGHTRKDNELRSSREFVHLLFSWTRKSIYVGN